MRVKLNDPLLQPFTLGALTLKNRVFSSSHAPGYNTDGTPSKRYVAYHEEKARGGIGLTMIGGSSNVSIDSPSLWGQLNFSTDAIIEPLAQMTDRIHAYGAAVMCQLTHMGRRNVSNDGHWLPTVAPSPIREPMHRGWPKQLEHHEIRRIVSDFGDAARRARAGGLDGVELCATSHLIDQFWTPLANQRTDEYGGSLENRLRFTFEVLESIRNAIDIDILVGIRMIANEDQIGGLDKEESREIAQLIGQSGFVDFINITSSSLATEEGLSKAIPPSGTPLMPYLGLAASIKETVNVAVFHATRITDVASARHAITSGLVDLVGMTRAHIADPHIVAKLESGNEDRIRVCVGASLCINRLHQGLESVCIQNPATGRETHISQLIDTSPTPGKKAVVVGAGPGGLEAARVLAERGHSVVLFEAQDRVGGQVVLAARASEAQAELLGITGWLEQEIGFGGVDLRLNSPVDKDDVVRESPDIVIVASGGLPDTSYLSFGGGLVTTSWDILGGHVRLGDTVLIYDNNGNEVGPSVAEFLRSRHVANVELVTPDRLVAQDLAATTGPAYLRMLYEYGVTLTPDHYLVGVRRDAQRLQVTLRNVYTNTELIRHVSDVVVEHGVVPNEDLYLHLKPDSTNNGEVDLGALVAGQPQPNAGKGEGDGYQLYRIGDAVASRSIAAAIYDARRLCRLL